MLLQTRGEGQWLIPGLCEEDRWDQEKEVAYPSVKAVWLNTFQRANRQAPSIDVVIEKSPPNMMRMERLSSQFRDVSFIANNRDPYAQCASALYHHDISNASADLRATVLREWAGRWIMSSSRIKQLASQLSIPLLTYEDFCQTPSAVLDILDLPDGVSKSIDPHSKVRVKKYDVQAISDQNARQISNLTPEEIALIGNILEPNGKLLEYFGYGLMRQ
jgi:hypothetical protein